jgi:hypothetical protein
MENHFKYGLWKAAKIITKLALGLRDAAAVIEVNSAHSWMPIWRRIRGRIIYWTIGRKLY